MPENRASCTPLLGYGCGGGGGSVGTVTVTGGGGGSGGSGGSGGTATGSGSGGGGGSDGSGGVLTTIGAGGAVTPATDAGGAGGDGWAAGTVPDALEAVGRATERAAAVCLASRSCFVAAPFARCVASFALTAACCLPTVVLTACGRAAASEAFTA